MTRSFSNRVFSGVCGGLARSTRINTWVWRIAFIALAIATRGGFIALYAILWWIVPLESPVQRRRGFPFIFALLLIAGALALWAADLQGALVSETGASLYLPVMLAAAAAVFFLRQISLSRGR
jgi:phage shock protein PspC (stress-responsive transcriptional regulator)